MSIDPNSSQFDYLVAAIRDKYPGMLDQGENTFFQFCAAPMAASWGSASDTNAYDIANSVPANLDQFYMPGGPLDQAYQSLLNSIMPAEAQNNPDWVRLQRQLHDLMGQQTTLTQKAIEAYNVWAANNQNANGTSAETKQAWLQDAMGGISFGNQLADIQSDITELNKEMAAILKSMNAALSQAISNLGTDTMPISSGGPAIKVPTVRIDGDLPGDKTKWDSAQNQYELQVQVTGDSVIKSPWKTVYSTTVKQSCYQTDVTTSVNVSRIITDVSYKLEYSAVGFNTYKITRGSWFDETFVNPNQQITTGAAGVTNDYFFGMSGSLHMIPQAIVVIYKPTIKLTVSEEVYKQQFETNADVGVNWVDLFGSRFQVDSMSSLQPVPNGDQTITMTFKSPDETDPTILGVISTAAFNGNV